jgi:hypothetical protein
MIVLGIVLLIVGLLFGIHLLFIIGLVLAALGAVLLLAGSTGHEIGGRNHYW